MNEKSKFCTSAIVGDEYADVDVGNCKVKDFYETSNSHDAKTVCEKNGYIFTPDSIKTFCSGPRVGRFIPLNSQNNTYFAILKIIFSLSVVILILFLLLSRKVPKKTKFVIIILVTMFILFVISISTVRIVTVKN